MNMPPGFPKRTIHFSNPCLPDAVNAAFFDQSVEQPGLTLCFCIRPKKQRKRTLDRVSIGIRRRPSLPGRVQPSTIGAEGLNFCVRYGNRWDPFAIATGNCIVLGGLRSAYFVLLRLLIWSCPRYRIIPRGKSFSFRNEPSPSGCLSFLPSGLLTLPAALPAHQVRCVLRFLPVASAPAYSRPLSHLDNRT